jgi:hypothetical protein
MNQTKAVLDHVRNDQGSQAGQLPTAKWVMWDIIHDDACIQCIVLDLQTHKVLKFRNCFLLHAQRSKVGAAKKNLSSRQAAQETNSLMHGKASLITNRASKHVANSPL